MDETPKPPAPPHPPPVMTRAMANVLFGAVVLVWVTTTLVALFTPLEPPGGVQELMFALVSGLFGQRLYEINKGGRK